MTTFSLRAVLSSTVEAKAAPAPTAELVLEVCRLRALRFSLWMQHVWRAGQSSPDQGLAITAAEVAHLLAGDEAKQEEAHFFSSHGEAVALGGAADRAAAALAEQPDWRRLRSAFGLDDQEADLLALAVAAELDPGLQRVIAYLHDDARWIHPTALLSERLAGRQPSPPRAEGLLRWRLAQPIDDGSRYALTTAWRADPAVVHAVGSGEWLDGAIADALSAVEPAEVADLDCLYPDALAALQAADDLSDIVLTAPDGAGRRTLAAQFAVAAGRSLLVADLAALPGDLAPRDALRLALRQAKWTDALAYFKGAELVAAADWQAARSLGVPFLRGGREAPNPSRAVKLQALSLATRRSLWRGRTAEPIPDLLSILRLTPGEIARLVGSPASGPELLAAGRRPDHALLTSLPQPYVWDDLVLPADVEHQLRDFADQVRLRWTVYEDWGFSRLAHLGFGITALFGGPSGTGKTMAAQVIARTLGLELYRVDLAGVVNKYVGETEKKLREVFDACEHTGALLFFDEADALFGARMQVKDAHDRFANIEINYLLQRIESFDGVAILATNRRGDIDQAFIRRLRFVVEFLPPRPEERLALWRRALATQAPDGSTILGEVDWLFLAERLQMTGAEIKNTALAAAFLAKAEGALIGMRHVLAAAGRELAKQGLKLRLAEGTAS